MGAVRWTLCVTLALVACGSDPKPGPGSDAGPGDGSLPSGSFSLSIDPVALAIDPGATTTATLTVARIDGFASEVAITITDLPAGVTVPGSIIVPATSSSIEIVFAAAATAAPASGTATITGSAAELVAMRTVAITIGTRGGWDPSFGTGGLVTHAVAAGNDVPYAIARAANGTLVGLIQAGPLKRTVVARVTATGALDTTFGAGGAAEIPGLSVPQTLAAIAGDKTLVLGTQGIARLGAAGDLDSTFGTAGIMPITFGQLLGLGLQSDNKILAMGVGAGPEAGLFRILPDGGLDPAFGTAGAYKVSFAGSWSQCAGVAVQADGKIVFSRGGFALTRVTASGTLDTTYNATGTTPGTTTPHALVATRDCERLLLQGDKVVAAGNRFVDSFTSEFVVTRYNGDGTLDTTFASGGVLQIPNTGMVHGIHLASDGKLLITGNHTQQSYTVIARLDANGVLDTTFDADGVISTTVRAQASTLDTADSVTSIGYTSTSLYRDVLLQRVLATAVVDTTFGTSGVTTIVLRSSSDQVLDIEVEPSGNYLLLGNAITVDNFPERAVFARVVPTGALDTSFATGGVFVVPQGNSWTARSLVRMADGGVAFVGRYCCTATTDNLMRFTPALAQDNTFANFSLGAFNEVRKLAVAPDGKFVIIGGRSGTADFLLKRRTPTGTAAGFNGGSTDEVSFEVSGASRADQARAVAFAGTTHYVIAGDTVSAAGPRDFALVRMDAVSGALDPTFGTAGIVRTDLGGDDSATAAAVLTDGKVIAAGVTTAGNGGVAVARYTAAGVLDTTFGTAGIAILPVDASGHVVRAVVLQADGKLLLAGEASDGTTVRAFVVRFTATGVLDPSFGTAGILRWSGSASRATSMRRLSDGKILVGGSVRNLVTGEDFALWRIAP